MHVNVNIRIPEARESEADFIVQMLADVVAPSAFSQFDAETDSKVEQEDELEPEFVVGRVWAERLDWLLAEECGYDVLPICNESGTWMQVLETISRNGGRSFRKDLNLENLITDVVFVHEVLLHPEIEDRIAILDAVLRGLAGENSLVLMHYEQTEEHHLEDWEGHELGFKKIARNNLLIRDNHFRYPFNDKCPGGRRVEFEATVEHEDWLLGRWHDLITDHPSL